MDTSAQEGTLCKYLSIYTLTQILTNRTIRFTQPSAFNDPFDMLPNYLDIIDQQKIHSLNSTTAESRKKFLSEAVESSQELQILHKSNPKSFEKFFFKLQDSFTPFLKDFFGTYASAYSNMISENLQKTTMETLGALCLTGRNDHPLMWAHYAEEHRGAVLILNTHSEFFEQSLAMPVSYLDRVEYVRSRPQISADKYIDNIKNIVFTKSEHWEYEREWRLVAPLKDAEKSTLGSGESLFLFPLQESCIRGIIFGCRCSNSDREKVLKLLENPSLEHVNVYDAEMDNAEYIFRIVRKANITIDNLHNLLSSKRKLAEFSSADQNELDEVRQVCSYFEHFDYSDISQLLDELEIEVHDNDPELSLLVSGNRADETNTLFYQALAKNLRLNSPEKWLQFVKSKNKARVKMSESPLVSTKQMSDAIGDENEFLDQMLGVQNVKEYVKFAILRDEEFLTWYKKYIYPVQGKFAVPDLLQNFVDKSLEWSGHTNIEYTNVFRLLKALLGQQALAETLVKFSCTDYTNFRRLNLYLDNLANLDFSAQSTEQLDAQIVINTLSSIQGLVSYIKLNSGVVLDSLVRFSLPIRNLLEKCNIDRDVLLNSTRDRNVWLYTDDDNYGDTKVNSLNELKSRAIVFLPIDQLSENANFPGFDIPHIDLANKAAIPFDIRELGKSKQLSVCMSEDQKILVGNYVAGDTFAITTLKCIDYTVKHFFGKRVRVINEIPAKLRSITDPQVSDELLIGVEGDIIAVYYGKYPFGSVNVILMTDQGTSVGAFLGVDNVEKQLWGIDCPIFSDFFEVIQ